MNNHYGNRINRIAFRIRCSVVGALFKKSTALSTGGKAVYSAGEIVNMMSNDADRCRNLIVQINQLWMLPFNFAFALYLLVDLVGRPNLSSGWLPFFASRLFFGLPGGPAFL